MAVPVAVSGVALQIGALGPFVAVFVPLVVLAVLFLLLLDIRTNTRRTAAALERLAEQQTDGDDRDRGDP